MKSEIEMDQPRYSYDKEADIIFLDIADGEYSHSVHVNETDLTDGDPRDEYIMLDYSTDGTLLGIEIQYATKVFEMTARALQHKSFDVPYQLLATLSRGLTPAPA